MKRKVVSWVIMMLLLGAWSGAGSFAQDMPGMPGDEPPPMEHKGMMMGHGKHGKSKMGMPPQMMGMMKGMMAKSMVATSDGGVAVMAGNKLMKFDKDLNLVREVEIKVDMAAMQKEMMEMMKNCPMNKELMKGPAEELKALGTEMKGPGEDMKGSAEEVKVPAGESVEPPPPPDANPPVAEPKPEPQPETQAEQK